MRGGRTTDPTRTCKKCQKTFGLNRFPTADSNHGLCKTCFSQVARRRNQSQSKNNNSNSNRRGVGPARPPTDNSQ